MALPADNDKMTKTDDTPTSSPLQVGVVVSDDKGSAPLDSTDDTATPTPVTPIIKEEPLGPPPSSPNQSVDGYGDGESSLGETKKENEVSPPAPKEIKTEHGVEEKLNNQTPPPAPPPPNPPLDSNSSKTNIDNVPKVPIGNSSLGPKPLGFATQPTAPEKPIVSQAPEPPKVEEKKAEKPKLSEVVTKAESLVGKEKKEEKKKEKGKSGGRGKKIVLAVLGFFLLLGGLAAGYYYYSAQTAQVAEVSPGSQLAQPCTLNSQCSSGQLCIGGTCVTTTQCSNGAYCGGCIKKCVSWTVINSYGGGCQAVIDAKCGGGLEGQAKGICDSTYSNPKCLGKAFGHEIEGRVCVWLKNQVPPDKKNKCGLTSHCNSSSGLCNLQGFGSACGDGGTCTAGEKDDRGWPQCSCKGQGTDGDGSMTCNQGVSSGCGAAPDPVPSFSTATDIGPFPEAGKLVVYFYGMDSEANTSGGNEIVKIHLTHNGSNYFIPVTQLTDGKQRILTDIEMSVGDIVKLTNIEEEQQTAQCAEDPNPPYYGTGWIAPNSDSTCGTGLAGPPTGGQCVPFGKPDVSEAISWAEGYGQGILSKQCWADWREWPGDYDFNDYFVMFSYEPVGAPSVVCNSITSDPSSINLGDNVSFVCDAQASTSEALNYEFRYRIDGGDYQQLSATDNLASLLVDTVGTYEVQCRACISSGSICSAEWSATGQ